MPNTLSQSQIDAKLAQGARVNTIARMVKGTLESPALVEALKNIGAAQMQSSQAQSQALISSIKELMEAISNKESNLNLSELVEAIQGLKSATEHHKKPEQMPLIDYKMTGTRNNRGFIDIEAGLMFTAIARGPE